MFKYIIRNILESYVRQYFKAHPDIKLVVVAGSVGKTSTKMAIVTVLSEKFKVRAQEGNHNTHFSAPLAIMGVKYPEKLKNLSSWLQIFKDARNAIKQPTDIDVIVQEIGTDGIGQIPHFGKYLKPDIGVLTTISPEHMEFFHDIDTVASEELSIIDFCKQVLIGKDDVDEKYTKGLPQKDISYYGINDKSDFYFQSSDFKLGKGYSGKFFAVGLLSPIDAQIGLLGEHNLRSAVAAGAVAAKLGLTESQIKNGLSKITAVSRAG